MKKCSITGCDRKYWAKGLCTTHLWRLNHGLDLNASVRKEHGLVNHPLYARWGQMRSRCTNPKNTHYVEYGGRGITVCKRWDSFVLFLKDVGEQPTPRHTLDRKDNDGNYEPSNVRWATPRQQAQNTRKNNFITIDGTTKCFAEWARHSKLKLSTVRARYYMY